MIVELDDDFTDEIVVQNLAQTYVVMQANLKNAKKIDYFHEEDIELWKALLPALKQVLAWYCCDVDAEIRKAKRIGNKK